MIDALKNMLNNKKLREEISLLLNLSESSPNSNNYFGINYNSEGIVSLKLYFSFMEIPSNKIFNRYNLSRKDIEFVKNNWNANSLEDYSHKGITIGLKCYPAKNDTIIDGYVHFRTMNAPLFSPSKITVDAMDLNNFPGYCIQTQKTLTEYKNYFYITSKKTQQEIIEKFNISKLISTEELISIEYTESKLENKINLNPHSTEVVKRIIESLAPKEIIDFCLYLYSTFDLCYYAPGFRLNNDTKAIYFVPKKSLHSLNSVKTVKYLFEIDF
jgi:hypothetical protein